MKNNLTYWLTLDLMKGIDTRRKNDIYSRCFLHNPQISISELFDNPEVWQKIGLSDEEQQIFSLSLPDLPNNAFLAEDMLSQGYSILPIDSKEYPTALKKNLKKGAPTVVYAKGNISLLNEPPVAEGGSKVRVLAQSVDKSVLHPILENECKAIIVLQQGIMTFSTGFRQHYRYITQGKLLVISTFPPKARWSSALAIASNAIIQGLGSSF